MGKTKYLVKVLAGQNLSKGNKKYNSSKKEFKGYWGGVIIGFAIIFIGLDFLKNATPDIDNNQELLLFLTKFSNLGYWSLLIYLVLGTLITMVGRGISSDIAKNLVTISSRILRHILVNPLLQLPAVINVDSTVKNLVNV